MRFKIWIGALLIFLCQTQFSWAGKSETKPEAKPEAKTEAKSEAKTEAKPEAKAEAKTEAKAESAKIKTAYKTPRKSQVVGFDANGNPVYFGENYPSRQASTDELKTSLLNTSMNVARTVCDLSVKPESVTAPVGAISLTWDTEKLCKALKSNK